MAARFTATEVRRVLGLSEIAMSGSFTSVSTDTRNLQPGALFVALQGDRFDGTDFVMEAERLGAAGAVIPASAGEPPVDLTLFSVDDTTVALGDLARYHRQRCEARVVGVTGSSGKTTVKEMLVRAISPERRVHATVGNLNNQVGLPLSILAASDDTEVWVLELGASEPGEIRRLTSIAEPDDAVVTTVGPAHLEGLGDITGVLEEKLALVRGASRSGSVVVGELPEMLPEHAREIRDDVVTAGLGSQCDFRPAEWSLGPTEARFRHEGTDYSVPVGGEHHLRDALIATAMAMAVGVGPAAIARGLAEYRPVGLRSCDPVLCGLVSWPSTRGRRRDDARARTGRGLRARGRRDRTPRFRLLADRGRRRISERLPIHAGPCGRGGCVRRARRSRVGPPRRAAQR
jgi:UDP-N-acetylmuramoyl-tripeptide--D-alanyl-D-alanine ligase